MRTATLLLIMFLLSACGPSPELKAASTTPHDAALPSTPGDAAWEPFVPVDAPDDDAAAQGAVFEYRAGECAVQFDPTTWSTSGDRVVATGRVHCAARVVADRVAIETADGAFLANDECRERGRPVILEPGAGAASGARFTMVLVGRAAGTHAAEVVLRNTRMEGGVAVPADEIERFVAVYTTGLPAGGRPPEGLGPRAAFGRDEAVAVGRLLTARAAEEAVDTARTCFRAVRYTASTGYYAGCAYLAGTAGADAALESALRLLVARVPGVRIDTRATLDRALSAGLLAKSALTFYRSARGVSTALRGSYRTAPAVVSSEGDRRALSDTVGLVTSAADILETLLRWVDPPRAETFVASDGRVGVTLHLSVPAPLCSATRVTADEVSLTLVTPCGDGRCGAGETTANCPSDCRPAPTPPALAASLRVTEPTGGVLIVGQRITARWVGANLTTPVRLVVRRAGREFATARTDAPASGSDVIEVFPDWGAGDDWEVCATAHMGALWSCSPRFQVRAALDASLPAPDAAAPAPGDVPARDAAVGDVPSAFDAPPAPDACADVCAPGAMRCDGATRQLRCFAPFGRVIPCATWSEPETCLPGTECVDGAGCRACGGSDQPCCSGSTCRLGLRCAAGRCTAEPASPREVCDGLDNDGNGRVDDIFVCILGRRGEGCATRCGTAGTRRCVRAGDVCAWSESCEPYGEAEGANCSNTVDDDCDGRADCDDPSCASSPACARRCGDRRCDPGEDCARCADCACAAGNVCAAGACVSCGRRDAPCCEGGACEAGLRCEAGRCACPDADGDGCRDARCGGSDCNDADPLAAPGQAERCNGADDNCNGAVDDGCRRLRVELTGAAQRECAAGGWQLVTWDPSGREYAPLAGAGQALELTVPAGWRGMLGVGARCLESPVRWRDWSPYLGMPTTASGVARVLFDGRDITAGSPVCFPWWVQDAHPGWPASWGTVLLVPVEASLEGGCPRRP